MNRGMNRASFAIAEAVEHTPPPERRTISLIA